MPPPASAPLPPPGEGSPRLSIRNRVRPRRVRVEQCKLERAGLVVEAVV